MMKDLYQRIYNVLEEYRVFNQNSMTSMQSIGLNGFKRKHRLNTIKLQCWIDLLACELYDTYEEKMDFTRKDINYDPKEIKDHLEDWIKELKVLIKDLGTLNKEFFNNVGMENCFIKKALCMMTNNQEKAKRWYKRFTNAKWEWHDISVLDYFLHEKIRKKEKHIYDKLK